MDPLLNSILVNRINQIFFSFFKANLTLYLPQFLLTPCPHEPRRKPFVKYKRIISFSFSYNVEFRHEKCIKTVLRFYEFII